MSYPFDQWTALAGANRQLALKCAGIVRDAASRQMQLASHAFASLSAPSAEVKQGLFQAPNISGISEMWKEMDDNRQQSLVESQAAFEEWRASADACFSLEDAQQQIAGLFRNWTGLFASPSTPAASGKDEAAGAATPSRAKASPAA